MAWGKRGIPIAIAVMFSMIFSMATPTPDRPGRGAASARWHFGLGAGLYVIYATLANLALNARYRVQLMADVLLFAGRADAHRGPPVHAARRDRRRARHARAAARASCCARQAALADQMQAARDIVLESPRTPRRQRLAGMLVIVLEMRDQLLASELDLDALTAHARARARRWSRCAACSKSWPTTVAALADALLLGRQPAALADRRPALAAIHLADGRRAARAATPARRPPCWRAAWPAASATSTTRCCACRRWRAASVEPDLAVVRANWQMFVSPTALVVAALPHAVALGRAAAAPRDPRRAGHRGRLRHRGAACPGARTTTGSC